MSRKELSLPKTKRLTLSSEFARVKGQGSSERGRYLVLGAAKVKEEKLFRAGFITPKHIGTAAPPRHRSHLPSAAASGLLARRRRPALRGERDAPAAKR
jgi:hypothetical protein